MVSFGEPMRRAGIGGKGFLLYLLPLPLALAAVGALLGGNFSDLLLSIGLFLLFMLTAWLARQGLRQDDQSLLMRARWWGRLPFRTIAGGALAVTTYLSAHFAAGHGLAMSLGYAVTAFAGFAMAYGLEPLEGAKARPSAGDKLSPRAAATLHACSRAPAAHGGARTADTETERCGRGSKALWFGGDGFWSCSSMIPRTFAARANF